MKMVLKLTSDIKTICTARAEGNDLTQYILEWAPGDPSFHIWKHGANTYVTIEDTTETPEALQ